MPISPVLSKLLDLLPGERPANGPVGGNRDDAPSTTDLPGPDPFDMLPPGIAQRIAERGPDALPPGIARQLAEFAPSPPSPPTPMSSPVSTPTMPGSPITTSAPATDPLTQMVNQIAQQQGQGRSQGPGGPVPMEQVVTERFPPGMANRMVTTTMSQGPAPAPQPFNQPQQAVPVQAPTNSTPLPAPNPTQAPRTGGNVVPNSVPPPTANANAVPARADTLPPLQSRPDTALAARGEQAVLDRASMMARPMGAAVAGPALASAAAQAAQVLGQTAQVVPLSQVPVDSRGILLPANDRAMAARTEPVLGTPIYTADGPTRRRSRRLTEALPAQLTRWLWLAGMSGNPTAMRDPDPEKDGWFALQWLYWLLAIVAYGCLALALVAMLPSGADAFVGSGSGFSRTTLGIGVVAAAAAWWLARRMTRR